MAVRHAARPQRIVNFFLENLARRPRCDYGEMRNFDSDESVTEKAALDVRCIVGKFQNLARRPRCDYRGMRDFDSDENVTEGRTRRALHCRKFQNLARRPRCDYRGMRDFDSCEIVTEIVTEGHTGALNCQKIREPGWLNPRDVITEKCGILIPVRLLQKGGSISSGLDFARSKKGRESFSRMLEHFQFSTFHFSTFQLFNFQLAGSG